MTHAFVKMNGLGNDFVVVTPEGTSFAPSAAEVRAIADRARGIGCDQLIGLGPSHGADAAIRIWNADGGEVERCGNAERCVAWLLMQASGRDRVSIEAGGRILSARRAGDGAVSVDMGAPGLNWRDIPLAWEMDTREIDLHDGPDLRDAGCVSMGNPHVVFFVPNLLAVPVAEVGPAVEHHWLFPERVNVGFAQIVARDRIRLRVWERGAGLTKACGTGACAALVAAHRKGLTDRAATLELDGGELKIEWRKSDDHVLMTGPTAVEFTGRLPAFEPGGRSEGGRRVRPA